MPAKKKKVAETEDTPIVEEKTVKSGMEKDPNAQAIRFLHDSGLLFKVNQQLLHPHGLGLEADIRDGVCMGFKPLVDKRNEEVGVLYQRAEFKEQRLRFLEYMRMSGSDKLKLRQEKLGFVVQDESK